MDITDLSATRLAKLIKNKEITSLEIVSKHIERAKLVNPKINAIVKDNFDNAIVLAKKADEKIKNDEPVGIFHGVPCTIKECFEMQGMPNSSGLVSRKNIISSMNAPTVQRIIDSGAIPIGVTNTSELCMWYESYNKVYGRTKNPYNQNKIVGGSSGGEGAIIGSGASPFGLGSDIGGSIRMPAFFNGVFGHKGSGGLIPNTGQFPAPKNPIRYLSTGPLCRKAEDLLPLVEILKGKDGIDESVDDTDLDKHLEINLKSLKVYNLADISFNTVDKDLKESQENVLNFFKKNGATIYHKKIKAFDHAFEIWSAHLSKESGKSGFSKLLGHDKSADLFKHLLLSAIKKSPHTLPAILLGLTENIGNLFPKRTKKMEQMGEDMKEELDEMLSENSILIFPSHPRVAPNHNYPILKPFAFTYTGILNIAEIPVTQVPLGLNKNGLPLGIQIGAKHGKDALTIKVAEILEKEFGGWVKPTL
jgi:fatty acid amide hydrolase 2